MKVSRPTFVLRIRPEKGADPTRALRRLLKVLLRTYKFRCLGVAEEGGGE